MTEGAVVLYREKLVSRGVAIAGVGLGAFAGVATFGATQTGEIGAAGAVIGGAIALALGVYGVVASVVRVAVTRDEIRVSQGGRSRAIPLAAITSTELQTYRTATPVAVVVKWRASGAEHAFAIPSSDPKALRDVLEDARAPKRVAASADASREDEAEEEEAAREGAAT